MNTIKILLSLLRCTVQNNNNMNELIQAVIAFLEKNITSKNRNKICDFSVNVHLLDGTECSDFENVDKKGTLLHLTV